MGSLNTSELDTDLSREMEVKNGSISSSRKDTKHLDRNIFEITPEIC